ncbi:lysine-specific demethylase 7B-like [Oscarella lobularis]|uniref:lysine-specific demethylase 7B-like n=1 Tax=Oscarella lobularis TaxID=121494 RepID=UPI003313B33A
MSMRKIPNEQQRRMAETNDVYCICRQPYNPSRFMIECGVCRDWFHGSCVNVLEHEADDIDDYHCPTCARLHGPTTMKRHVNWHRHNSYDSSQSSKAVQSGTSVFVRQLLTKKFSKADPILLRLPGSSVTASHFDRHGFSQPILVDNLHGLGLVVPPATWSVADIEKLVGSDMILDVIDVSKQQDFKMTMRQWTEYYTSPSPKKTFNVISLEFSQTSLSHYVIAPECVRELDWLDLYWPQNPEDSLHIRPAVQKYCLMSVAGSYTDFHLDFGGTSVWYHIVKGEKVFYLIQPTPRNLAAFEKWAKLPSSSEIFFGEMADWCYKCHLKAGQTLFIPTGWIHAVLTPVDSLVFGGNFLHRYNIGLQLKIYEMEQRLQMPNRFRHPSYETLHWYAAQHLLEDIKGFHESEEPIPSYLSTGMKVLAETLQLWLKTDGPNAHEHRSQVPDSVVPNLLVRDIQRVLKAKASQTSPNKSNKRSPLKLTIPKSLTQGLATSLDSDLMPKKQKANSSSSSSSMKPKMTNGKIARKHAKAEPAPTSVEHKPLTLKLSVSGSSASIVHSSSAPGKKKKRASTILESNQDYIYSGDDEEGNSQPDALLSDHVWEPKEETVKQPNATPSKSTAKKRPAKPRGDSYIPSTKQPSSSSSADQRKRPKKGHATSRQRLGKILKIDKSGWRF